MIAQVEETLSKKGKYMNICSKARKVAEMRFLENEENISKYHELYNYGYRSAERVNLNTVNP